MDKSPKQLAMKKKRIGLLFGGRSVEHEVSLLSVQNILRAMDPHKYDITLIGIDKMGYWHICDPEKFLHNAGNLKNIELLQNPTTVTIDKGQLCSLGQEKERYPIDVIFPVLHGTFGEDGTLQGLLKLAAIPFVGASVLSSAVGMDKEVAKRLLRDAGIPVAKFLCLHQKEWGRLSYEKAVELLGRPFFIKPSSSGSSVGISKVHAKEEFEESLQKAFQYDRKVLIEQAIVGREIECGVIGNDYPIVSLPGEIFHRDAFYSYEAKYMDMEGTRFEIPAALTPEQLSKIQITSLEAYRVLDCEGMARIDLFLTPHNEVLVNEINTIPGFTNSSPFPRLWEASGIPYSELIDRLIQLAIDRYEKEKPLKTHYALS